MSDPVARRRFDDEQVSLILRRAAELQEAGAERGGMTLAELEQIAREAGLDPAHVRRAAAEVGGAPAGPTPALGGSRVLGAPTVLRVERVVEGELPATEVESLLGEVRRTFNDLGTVSTFGQAVTWRASGGAGQGQGGTGRQVSVTVTVRDRATVIRIEESTGGLAGGLYGGLMGGIGGAGTGLAIAFGFGMMESLPAAAAIWTTVLGAGYALARTIFTSMSRHRAGALHALADRLAEFVRGAAAVPDSPVPEGR